MHGQGGFWDDAWKTVRTPLYDLVGTGIKTVAPWSSGLVDEGRAAMKAAGYGSYVTNRLVNKGHDRISGVPMFKDESDTGALKFVFRELVADIYAPKTAEEAAQFQKQVFEIQPGLYQSFPWLSQIACNYEQYKVNQLIYTYKPSVQGNVTTTSGIVGDVMLASQLNKRDKQFEDAEQLQASHGAAVGLVSDHISIGVECDPKKTPGDDVKSIRYQGLSDDRDLQDYDKGKVTIATRNLPSALVGQQIGKLYVSYNITLQRQKIVSGRAKNLRQDIMIHTSNTEMEVFSRAGEFVGDALAVAVIAATPLQMWSNTDKAYNHKHNTIGCTLQDVFKSYLAVPKIHGTSTDLELIASKRNVDNNCRMYGLQIEFPPNVSGDFEILIKVTSTFEYDEAVTDLGYLLGGTQCWRAPGANITPIKDICGGHVGGRILNNVETFGDDDLTINPAIDEGGTAAIDGYLGAETDFATADSYQSAHIRCHVRVKRATGGNRNIVSLFQQACCSADDTSPPKGTLNHSLVEIKEYNALDDLASRGFMNGAGSNLAQRYGGLFDPKGGYRTVVAMKEE